MFGQLTEKPNHSFGLPVIDTFDFPKAVTGPNKIQHSRNIFLFWTDKQLNEIGYARIIDNGVSDGMVSTGFSDKITSNKITRTHTEEAAPPPPMPDPANYKHNRRLELLKTIGADNAENMIGDQLDSILKWAVTIRMKQSDVAAAIDSMTEISASSRTALKAALDPVFDLPADLDSIVGKWTAAKAKFQKA